MQYKQYSLSHGCWVENSGVIRISKDPYHFAGSDIFSTNPDHCEIHKLNFSNDPYILKRKLKQNFL